jgi:hypothetical protein
MATKLTDRILEILRNCPYGLTAQEVAGQLDATAGNISSRLSKLAAYGIVVKTRGRLAYNVSPRAIYNAPTASSAAPASFASKVTAASTLRSKIELRPVESAAAHDQRVEWARPVPVPTVDRGSSK